MSQLTFDSTTGIETDADKVVSGTLQRNLLTRPELARSRGGELRWEHLLHRSKAAEFGTTVTTVHEVLLRIAAVPLRHASSVWNFSDSLLSSSRTMKGIRESFEKYQGLSTILECARKSR